MKAITAVVILLFAVVTAIGIRDLLQKGEVDLKPTSTPTTPTKKESSMNAGASTDAKATKPTEKVDSSAPSTKPAPSDQLPEIAPPKKMLAPAATGDKLADAFGLLISDIVLGNLRMEEPKEMEERMRRMLDESEVGKKEDRDGLAKNLATEMIANVSRYAPPTGATRVELDPQVVGVIANMSANFAANVRSVASGATPATSLHDGSMLNPSVQFVAPEGYEKISWKTIGSFLYKEGMSLPPEVKALDGKKVAVGGYMMSLGEYGNIHKFLLVEAQWSCCFGEPPDINQVIVVRIPPEKKGIELTSLGVMVIGKFEAQEVKEGRWVTSVYRLVADDVIEIE